MKNWIYAVIAIAAVSCIPSAANAADLVCDTHISIYTTPHGVTSPDEAVVQTGSVFRGTDTESCARAQALYTRLFGEALVKIYSVPESGVNVGQQIIGE